MSKKTFINQFTLVINLLLLTLLILTYISPFINPNLFWPMSILGLIFPILLLVNIIFLIHWTIKFKKVVFVNLIAILIGAPYIQRYIGGDQDILEKNYTAIKVMSYNVRMFNEYGWITNKEIKNNIIDFLNKENPDILCIQEFYSKEELRLTELKHKHIGLDNEHNQSNSMAIYSKYPQINRTKINIKGSNNTCIYSDIIVNKDTIRIYNIHLASHWFKESDYSFIKNPILETQKLKSGILGIIKRLKIAYQQRANEVDIIQTHIMQSPYPIILCGDFNETPVSYTYEKLSKNLADAFVLSSRISFGQTYVKIPTLRIDYIMHNNRMRSKNFITYQKINYSDHFPISSEILLPIP